MASLDCTNPYNWTNFGNPSRKSSTHAICRNLLTLCRPCARHSVEHYPELPCGSELEPIIKTHAESTKDARGLVRVFMVEQQGHAAERQKAVEPWHEGDVLGEFHRVTHAKARAPEDWPAHIGVVNVLAPSAKHDRIKECTSVQLTQAIASGHGAAQRPCANGRA